MSNAWKCLPVREFISQCNWEQVTLKKSVHVQAQRQQFLGNWKRLNVRDFFSLSNWSGKAAFADSLETAQSAAPDFSLMLPVASFWQCFNWSGEQPEIAPDKVEQIIEDTEIAIAEVKDFSLNDLSQLF